MTRLGGQLRRSAGPPTRGARAAVAACVLLTAVLSGCGGTVASNAARGHAVLARAVTSCAGQGAPWAAPGAATSIRTLGAYPTTAAIASAWDLSVNGVAPSGGATTVLDAIAPGTVVVVCYFSGEFTGIPGRPPTPNLPDSTAATVYHFIVVAVQPGALAILVAAAGSSTANPFVGHPPSAS